MGVTIREVAQLAGVSSATVSRVLSNHPHIREAVRQRVLAAMETLQYQPNRVARSLRAQQSKIIGLIISDIQNPFFLALVRAVEDVAISNGYAVFLCNTDEELNKEQIYIDLMLAEHVAGVIISPAQAYGDPCKELFHAGVPVVLIDRKMLDIAADVVIVDNQDGAFKLVDHLIKDGYTRIGAVLGDRRVFTNNERLQGYELALRKHHIELDPTLIRQGKAIRLVGYHATCELLDLPDPPRALFTGNNLLAVGALKAISDRGLRIPDDIAVASFDEIDWAYLTKPEMTVVSQPAYEIGKCATDLLIERITGDDAPLHEVILEATLNIRQSCADHARPHKPSLQELDFGR